MPLHVALIEPRQPAHVGQVGALCAAHETPLHLIGPLEFALDGPALRERSPVDWDAVDAWEHPDWFAFRDAIRRNRCIYFSARAERPLEEAPFRPNSVLVFGSDEGGLPDRILEKHARFCFRLPAGPDGLDLPAAVEAALTAGEERLRSVEPARRGGRSRRAS